ncbi:MAG: Cytochrome c protein [Ignavibacteria bacterium]|nr:Cytochrome c protein [Ignavibacteria bacterium]
MKPYINIRNIQNKTALVLTLIYFTLLLSCNTALNTPQSRNSSNNENISVPQGFPPVPEPPDNPITLEKIELGRRLFYEKKLSKNGDMPSCSHCMKQENAFADNTNFSKGNNNEPEYRRNMSLINAAYRKNLFWDGRGKAIEQPAYRSLFLPFILGSDTNVLQKRLEETPDYPEMFRKAFGKDAKPSAYYVSKAIATFVRTFISGNSAYDKYIHGDSSAMDKSAISGKELFFSDKTKCSRCHSGFLFTDGLFHNTAITAHYFDFGRYYITGKNNDKGKFLTPTLRNIEVRKPYMHDGSILSLEEVIEHYNNGGKNWYTKDTLIKPLNLTVQDKKDLLSFLKSLTDHEFLSNPKYKNPNSMR